MPFEIERKFVLERAPGWLARTPSQRIAQGYVADTEVLEVRLRQVDEERLLTIKQGRGQVRREHEFGLDEFQFEALWPLTASRRLRKRRHRIELADGLVAEADVYEGLLEGLVTVEVEFPSREAADRFEPPGWMGEEITGDERFANRVLARNGAPESRRERRRRMRRRRYRLRREEKVARGVRRIARGRVETAIESLSKAARGEDPVESVHSARKDLKKIRSLLRLVRDELGEDAYERENARYRDAGRLLSASRDARVKAGALASLSGPEIDFGASEVERDAALAAIEEIEKGGEAIEDWPLDGGGWSLIAPGLERSYRRGRRGFHLARKGPDPELVHEWRKRVKDLWYQLRLLRKAWPPLLGATVDELHALADLLGDHHDLAVLADDLGERDDLRDRERLLDEIARRQADLVERALALGERVYAEKPGAFRRRVHAYWRAWRS